MLARRQELNTQLQVLTDAFLLALSLWAAYVLRYYSTFWFNLSKSVDPQSNYAWLLIPIMAFGPILLDLQGFYQSPLNKTKWRSVMQIARAMIGLSIIVSACVIFLRLPLANRSVPLLFILIGMLVLLLKERIIVGHLRRKAMRGERREPVLLAGLPQDSSALVKWKVCRRGWSRILSGLQSRSRTSMHSPGDRCWCFVQRRMSHGRCL